MRPIRPALATADTELLGRPTCRRFVTGLWEIARGQLVVTPTVADELPGNVRMSEGRYWEDVLAHEMEKANQRKTRTSASAKGRRSHTIGSNPPTTATPRREPQNAV